MEIKNFRGKVFNPQVFEKYTKTLPSTKENSLVKNALFKNVNEYEEKMKGQAGGYAIVEPIKGRIGGTPVNYDGNTNIPAGNERPTFYQRKACYGNAMAWAEYDFTSSITGENFEAEAGEVKEFWDEQRQARVLAILNGIFGMKGGVNGQFAEKHTYKVNGALQADSCNRAAQKALGDKKKNLQVMYCHSMVSTNLEGLQLIDFLKYTDKDGVERELNLGQYNGKLVIVDDEMPSKDVYVATADTTVKAGKTYYTRTGESEANYKYELVGEPASNPKTANYYEFVGTEYTSYLFENGFFEYEPLSVEVPVEIDRNAREKGGHNDLISRVREIIVPKLISYTSEAKVSPEIADFENGANWELAKSADGTVYVDDKLIPVVRIISMEK